MSKEFILEQRYFFIKLKDIDYLNNEDTYRAISALQTLNDLFPAREGIIFEKDFSCYSKALQLLKESVEA